MQALLLEINKAVNNSSNGKLNQKKAKEYRQKYRNILKTGKKECPIDKTTEGPA